jgi:prevent-host-death family protein
MWTLQDAKNRFSAVVAAAIAGHPQEVSRRGKPAVVVLSVVEYHRLLAEAGAHRESFAAHLMAFPESGVDRLTAKPRAVEF